MVNNLYKYINPYYWFRKIVFSKIFDILFFSLPKIKRKIIFYSIYKSNHWRSYKKPNINESISGLGSDFKITRKLIVDLNNFIIKNNIKTILDIGCGDFNWMKHLVNDNLNIKYHGIDIVKEIIKINSKLYSNSRVSFECNDVLNFIYPDNFDLILIRDFFIHIKNKDIINTINKLKFNKCKFFAITNFQNIKNNIEIKGYGHHRLVNIEIKPFLLNEVFYKIEDYDRELNIYKNE